MVGQLGKQHGGGHSVEATDKASIQPRVRASLALRKGGESRALGARANLGERLRSRTKGKYFGGRKILGPRTARVDLSRVWSPGRKVRRTTETNRKEGGFCSKGSLNIRLGRLKWAAQPRRESLDSV